MAVAVAVESALAMRQRFQLELDEVEHFLPEVQLQQQQHSARLRQLLAAHSKVERVLDIRLPTLKAAAVAAAVSMAVAVDTATHHFLTAAAVVDLVISTQPA
jgi:hypothetical protein